MNVHPLARNDSGAAHPLFSPEQVFLWLPGLPGEEMPFCSYNARQKRGNSAQAESPKDANGAPLAPPYEVSRESFIAWNTRVNPHFPYHPVPLVRTLSAEEMEQLAEQVSEIIGYDESNRPVRPTDLLKHDNKEEILAALSGMGLLAKRGFPQLHLVKGAG